MTDQDVTQPQDEPAPLVPLLSPAEGVPDVVVDERRLLVAAQALAAGSGPLAIDAERASGYRYGQRAYLVQLRRSGAGTWLVDPVACPDLSPIGDAVADVEWVLHAATQDLPCLAEVGLTPRRLFDTELGARLLGLPRVGLGAVIERYLGYSLAKEHSAVDWSTRPLPEPWLRYAALDVELLVPLRDHIEADLAAAGKLRWAREEFDALLGFTGPAPRQEPWRRTSGMHKVGGRRAAAVIRELWQARDRIAAERDISPSRVLPDAALVALALRVPRTQDDLPTGAYVRQIRRYARQWLAAVDVAMRLPEDHLPLAAVRPDGPPPPRAWADRDPAAAVRLAGARRALGALAQQLAIPVENLVSPDAVRRLLWEPPADPTPEAVADVLRRSGARPWQVEHAVPILVGAITGALGDVASGDDEAVVTDE